MHITSTDRPGSDATVRERSISKKLPTIMQDLSRRCIATIGESVSTYPRRPKAEAFSNAVDVVERLRDPTDQVLNARHLRDLHTFISVTSLVLLIQLRPRESFVSTTGRGDGDDEVTGAGLRLSTTTI